MGLLDWLLGNKKEDSGCEPAGQVTPEAEAYSVDWSSRIEAITVKPDPEMQDFYKSTFFEVLALNGWGEDDIQSMYDIIAKAESGYINYDAWCNAVYDQFFADKAGWSYAEAPDVQGYDIPATAKEVCDKLNAAQLKEILAQYDIKPSLKDKKAILVERVIGLGSVDELSRKNQAVREAAQKLNAKKKRDIYDEFMGYIRSRAEARSALERYKAMGLKRAIWFHRMSAKVPRPSHMAMNGKAFDLNEGLFDPKEGRNIWPGELPGCHCSLRPVLPSLTKEE